MNRQYYNALKYFFGRDMIAFGYPYRRNVQRVLYCEAKRQALQYAYELNWRAARLLA